MELFRSIKDWWIMIPQDLKEKTLDALATLTKPHSTEWNDFEIWWNRLNAQEKSKVLSDFATFHGTACKCPLEDANELTTWDNRITVVDQFPLCKDIPRDSSLSKSIQQFMDYNDEKGRFKIFHMRV